MEALYNQSKIKAIGVSNYCASCLKCLLPKVHVPPVVNQFEFHVGMGADPHGIVSASENAHRSTYLKVLERTLMLGSSPPRPHQRPLFRDGALLCFMLMRVLDNGVVTFRPLSQPRLCRKHTLPLATAS